MALLDQYLGAWTGAEAAHLARRCTFGAPPDKLSAIVAQGMSAAVDAMVDYSPVDQPLEDSIAALPSDEHNDKIKNPQRINELEGWWLYRFAHSSAPLQQQFALFLHDHFVSEYGKVSANVTNSVNTGNDGSVGGQVCNQGVLGIAPDPLRKTAIVLRLLRDQHNLFLTRGHGSFREMLIAITRDPAMLIYLDNRLNIKGKPQENYAREIMELFSMGVGNYSEDDVRNVARAFTGETIRNACKDNWPYDYFFDAAKHDTGTDKKIFGTTLTPSTPPSDDSIKVIDLILNRISKSTISPAHSLYPTTALYMAWKLVNWFVSQNVAITHPVVAELGSFYFSNTSGGGFAYNTREALRKLLKSQFFYDASNRFNMYKHPVDYMVTALRNLGMDEPRYAGTAAYSLRDMGMRLFEPPTVEGWHHGASWVNSGNLIARFNYADRLSSTSVLPDSGIDLVGFTSNDSIMDFFASRLLLDPLTADERAVFNSMFSKITTSGVAGLRRRVRAALHLTMTMPRYQLK